MTNGSNSNIININVVNNITNNNGTNDITTSEIYRDSNDLYEEQQQSVNKNSHVIFRYKFTEDFMKELYIFSKIHQYDERKDFKDAWKLWSDEKEGILKIETQRLVDLGYKGDILDKMFKSARYYFRKKSTVKVEPKQRRAYISINNDLLGSMDRHITNNIYRTDYQPKSGFIEFCYDNEDIIKASIVAICDKGVNNVKLIEDKIKKTYKNRYFIITTK